MLDYQMLVVAFWMLEVFHIDIQYLKEILILLLI
jgi:hypothetical protein